MKNLLQLIVAMFLVVVTTLYANANTYNKSSKTQDMENFVKDFSVSKLIEDEIKAIEQQKVEEELEERERKRTIRVSRGISRSVPSGKTSMKTYMNYKMITNTSSAQYQLQQREDIYTDEEGFRKIGDMFVIAVGTYYGEVGQELIIKLSDDVEFDAIIGDLKDNKDTDSKNMQHRIDGSVVEFIIDIEKLDKNIKKMGDCSYSTLNNFKGNIVDIIVLPRDE